MHQIAILIALVAATGTQAAVRYNGVLSSYYLPGGSGNLIGTQGSWGEWGRWSQCSARCGGGWESKTRECIKPTYVVYGDGDCPGRGQERRECNTHHCKVNGGWSDWGVFGDCSAQCGGGEKLKYRTCTNPRPAYGGDACYGVDSQAAECNTHYCKVNGAWSAWGAFGECSAQCGGGQQKKYRTCTNPLPAYGGDACYGLEYEAADCNTHYCQVNGGWSAWGAFGECSAQCGGGLQKKYRTCTNPIPAYGGQACLGLDYEDADCNTHYCKVNGGWSAWGAFEACSTQCGGGQHKKYRTCTSPLPAYGGDACYGLDYESADCNTHHCKVNGGWSAWGAFEACSAQCGGGQQKKYRTCTNPLPAYGGDACYGLDYESADCNTHHCRVNGGWTEWGVFGDCSVPCGGGQQYKYRTCTNPLPAYGGDVCFGPESQAAECNSHYCPVAGGWSEWGTFGDCSAQCGTGYKTKLRYCNTPVPSYGGAQCIGSDSYTESCIGYTCRVNGGWSAWGAFEACSAQCGGGQQKKYRTCTNPLPAYGGDACYGLDYEAADCNTHHCKVNGGWSAWGAFEACSAHCGGGQQKKYRTCTSPLPAYGGDACYGLDYESADCNTHHCKVNGGWSAWGQYGACSAPCGVGYKTRKRECNTPLPLYGGDVCHGSDSYTVSCNNGYCAVDGGWTEWGVYGECSAQCGSGIKTRERYCTSPTPGYGGAQCHGSNTHEESCYGNNCSVNGGWTYWTEWSPCSGGCGSGRSYRSRACTNPRPSYGGTNCNGPATAAKTCHSSSGCFYARGRSQY